MLGRSRGLTFSETRALYYEDIYSAGKKPQPWHLHALIIFACPLDRFGSRVHVEACSDMTRPATRGMGMSCLAHEAVHLLLPTGLWFQSGGG